MVFDDVLNTIFLLNKHTEIQRFLHMLSCSTLLFFAKSKKRALHDILLLAPPVSSDMYFFIKI